MGDELFDKGFPRVLQAFRLIARLESDADFGLHLLILDYFILLPYAFI